MLTRLKIKSRVLKKEQKNINPFQVTEPVPYVIEMSISRVVMNQSGENEDKLMCVEADSRDRNA